MDKITLHPQAQDLLFKYYRALRLIFNDVLGHLEVDYISIALLNDKQQLFFFSSRPSIEQNLIALDLWQDDVCYQFTEQQPLIWNELTWNTYLKKYKLIIPQLSYAISLPDEFQNYQLSYAFGLETKDPSAHINLINNPQILKSMGKFCLLKILDIVQKDLNEPRVMTPPYLKIVTQN